MFWDNVAGVYDLFADIFNKETHKALIAAVSSRITPDDAVLECACGTGLLTGAIAKRCRTLLATDFSANMLKRAKKKYGALPNVTFRQADILHFSSRSTRISSLSPRRATTMSTTPTVPAACPAPSP